jgi:hypothetical protein
MIITPEEVARCGPNRAGYFEEENDLIVNSQHLIPTNHFLKLCKGRSSSCSTDLVTLVLGASLFFTFLILNTYRKQNNVLGLFFIIILDKV